MEALNEEALKKLEELMQSRPVVDAGQHEKISAAKDKWQAAWNEFLETLLVLERLEI